MVLPNTYEKNVKYVKNAKNVQNVKNVKNAKNPKNVMLLNKDTFSVRELIAWVNEEMQTSIRELSELKSGAIYCQFMHKLFPSSISFNKIYLYTNSPYEMEANFMLLRSVFLKLNIRQNIPNRELLKGRGHYEFLNWMRKFHDINDRGRPYDAANERKGKPIGFRRVLADKPVEFSTHFRRSSTILGSSNNSKVFKLAPRAQSVIGISSTSMPKNVEGKVLPAKNKYLMQKNNSPNPVTKTATELTTIDNGHGKMKTLPKNDPKAQEAKEAKQESLAVVSKIKSKTILRSTKQTGKKRQVKMMQTSDTMDIIKPDMPQKVQCLMSPHDGNPLSVRECLQRKLLANSTPKAEHKLDQELVDTATRAILPPFLPINTVPNAVRHKQEYREVSETSGLAVPYQAIGSYYSFELNTPTHNFAWKQNTIKQKFSKSSSVAEQKTVFEFSSTTSTPFESQCEQISIESIERVANGPVCEQFSNESVFAQFSNESVSEQFSNESVYGQFSNQSVCGQFSNESVSEQFSHESVSGQFSHESVSEQFSHESVSGQFSNQSVCGQFSNQSVCGQFSNQSVSGQFSNESVYGQFSNQSVSGQFSNESVSGQFSNESVYGQFPNQSVSGQFSNESVYGQFSNQSVSETFSNEPVSGQFSNEPVCEQSVSGQFSNEPACEQFSNESVFGQCSNESVSGQFLNESVSGQFSNEPCSSISANSLGVSEPLSNAAFESTVPEIISSSYGDLYVSSLLPPDSDTEDEEDDHIWDVRRQIALLKDKLSSIECIVCKHSSNSREAVKKVKRYLRKQKIDEPFVLGNMLD